MGGGESDFSSTLLGGVIALTAVTAVAVAAFYVLPEEHLRVPQREPAVRVARVSDFPVGASRVQTWGEAIILVVRAAESEYRALQGTSPLDGCLLDWDAEARRVVSPCGYLVYDLHGHAVAGLTTAPLQSYGTYVRDGVLYVTRD